MTGSDRLIDNLRSIAVNSNDTIRLVRETLFSDAGEGRIKSEICLSQISSDDRCLISYYLERERFEYEFDYDRELLTIRLV